jgi:hypothetical protein
MANTTTGKVSPELLDQLQQSASAKGVSIEQELHDFLNRRCEKKQAALSRIRARHGSLPSVTADEVTMWITASRQPRMP